MNKIAVVLIAITFAISAEVTGIEKRWAGGVSLPVSFNAALESFYSRTGVFGASTRIQVNYVPVFAYRDELENPIILITPSAGIGGKIHLTQMVNLVFRGGPSANLIFSPGSSMGLDFLFGFSLGMGVTVNNLYIGTAFDKIFIDDLYGTRAVFEIGRGFY